jgi:uncharacterized protein YecE (DUF72 family)
LTKLVKPGRTQVSTLIGTSGYVYPHWRKGVFYPRDLTARQELPYYAARFPTVELNSPFYRLPAPGVFRAWRETTPKDFVFAVKASRFITHMKRLRDCEAPLALFLERARELRPKLGPILFQLPPTQKVDLDRLSRFLTILPRGIRWVMEFRHPSWFTADTYGCLERRGVALCIPVGGQVTADPVATTAFAYVRMHAGVLPGGGFSPAQLRTWAGRIRAFRRAGRDVYVYFNNDWLGMAVKNALELKRLLRR